MTLRAGASGFLCKSVGVDALPRALRCARDGEAVVSRALTMRLIEGMRRVREDGSGMRPIRSPLTPREWEVLDLLCQERSTDEIADTLVLSVETVRSHIKSVLRKLGVRSRQEAVKAASGLRSGLVLDGVAPGVTSCRPRRPTAAPRQISTPTRPRPRISSARRSRCCAATSSCSSSAASAIPSWATPCGACRPGPSARSASSTTCSTWPRPGAPSRSSSWSPSTRCSPPRSAGWPAS